MFYVGRTVLTVFRFVIGPLFCFFVVFIFFFPFFRCSGDYPRMKIWQFFDLQRLAELQAKENEEYVRRCQQATAGTYVVPEKGKEYIFLNEEDQTEKTLLLNSGFKWSRHNYREWCSLFIVFCCVVLFGLFAPSDHLASS